MARQNFIASDVNKNKAAVLAMRYGKAYDVKMIAVPEKLSGDSQVVRNFQTTTGINLNSMPQTLLIMCVDSAQARRDVLQFFYAVGATRNEHLTPFIIDAGNEDNFGQVRCFSPVNGYLHSMIADVPDKSPITVDIPFIPIDIKYYNDLEDGPVQLSCADLDQTLAINAIMATFIMGIVQNYYYRQPFTFNQWSISLQGGAATQFLRPVDFNRICADNARVHERSRYAERIYNMESHMRNFKQLTAHFFAEQEAAVEKARLEAEKREKLKELADAALEKKPAKKSKQSKSEVEAEIQAWPQKVVEDVSVDALPSIVVMPPLPAGLPYLETVDIADDGPAPVFEGIGVSPESETREEVRSLGQLLHEARQRGDRREAEGDEERSL